MSRSGKKKSKGMGVVEGTRVGRSPLDSDGDGSAE